MDKSSGSSFTMPWVVVSQSTWSRSSWMQQAMEEGSPLRRERDRNRKFPDAISSSPAKQAPPVSVSTHSRWRLSSRMLVM